MARIMLIQVRNQALRTFLAGKRSFRIFGITITIRHAHDNGRINELDVSFEAPQTQRNRFNEAPVTGSLRLKMA